MNKLKLSMENLDEMFPQDFTEEQIASAKTKFFKELSLEAHKFYGGKIQVVPQAGLYGFQWFNCWYTPGVSSVSTTIRDNNDASFEISGRGNMVAVVSDSTRVLGDGDCTPPGGLGVMEGKAFLMKYLGGVDAVPLCIDSKNENGENDPQKIIDFVKMCQHSFGAVNLEDISQPQCYKVLDTLRESCDIPVWHDDAQGTASVTLAGFINALKLTGKAVDQVKIVLLGAGASNTTIARLLIKYGADPAKLIMFDSRGGLHKNRSDIQQAKAFYRKWELCEQTNPECIETIEEAMIGADALIALSKPGPDTVKPEWIKSMGDKPIVFTCANPVPEIYPYAAKNAGAYVVATGRGDFPNQVNNSLGFPGILKGALATRARKITDNMAITAAVALAEYAYDKGIDTENILPKMDDMNVFPYVASKVAEQAVKDGVARIELTGEQVYNIAYNAIVNAQRTTELLMKEGLIKEFPSEKLTEIFENVINAVRNGN